MTVSEMSSRLGNLMNDVNEVTYTSSIKLDALNQAQKELVLYLLSFGQEYSHVFDILNELMVIQSVSGMTSSGWSLSGVSGRNFLRNGYVNSSIIDDDGNERWCERITADRLGLQQNQYTMGTTRSPKIAIISGSLYLYVNLYPKDLTLYFIGEPYKLAVAASGSGKTQLVATSDLNVLLHDTMVLMAEVQLRRLRATERDIQEAQLVQSFVNQQIQAMIGGAKTEPESNADGQFKREMSEFMEKR